MRQAKVELHIHLDGAIRIETLIDVARKRSISLPAYDVETLSQFVSVDKPGSLDAFLKCFGVFLPVIIGDLEAIERIAYELCEDQAASGVVYFEARYSPHSLVDTAWLGTSSSHRIENAITARDVVQAVNTGLQRGEKDFGVTARSILCCMRGHPGWSLDVLELCKEFRGEGVVGIDLANHEVPASSEDIAAFEEAKCCGIQRTVHAGEAGPAANVTEALDILHADRIGHGYHVLDDEKLYKRVIDDGIHLEVCPTSSILTGSVEPPMESHPVKRFVSDGVNFSLNSDDPLVCRSRICDEFAVASNVIGLSQEDLTKATFNAARASFLPEAEKTELIKKLELMYQKQ